MRKILLLTLASVFVWANVCVAQIKVVRKAAPAVDVEHYVIYEWWNSWGLRDDKDYPLGMNRYNSLGAATADAKKAIEKTRNNGDWSITHFLIEGEPIVKEKVTAAKSRRLGRLSRNYEVGQLGPKAISTGKIKQKDEKTGKVVTKDDPGGISYGSYQLASKRGIGGSSVSTFVTDYYPAISRGKSRGQRNSPKNGTRSWTANPTPSSTMNGDSSRTRITTRSPKCWRTNLDSTSIRVHRRCGTLFGRRPCSTVRLRIRRAMPCH